MDKPMEESGATFLKAMRNYSNPATKLKKIIIPFGIDQANPITILESTEFHRVTHKRDYPINSEFRGRNVREFLSRYPEQKTVCVMTSYKRRILIDDLYKCIIWELSDTQCGTEKLTLDSILDRITMLDQDFLCCYFIPVPQEYSQHIPFLGRAFLSQNYPLEY